MTKLAAGDKAPAFKLANQDDKAVSLADFKGKKVIVYFYPAAATPGCTKQACDFQENLNVFKKAGFEVVGVSPDAPAKLAKFKTNEGEEWYIECVERRFVLNSAMVDVGACFRTV